MKLNEHTVVSSSRLLLVPYDAHHVPTYHEWMSDPAIQEATASEPLTLQEEYENQVSWRTSGDKLTFILCLKNSSSRSKGSSSSTSPTTNPPTLKAGEVDTSSSMIGDINLFLTPCDDDDDDDDQEEPKNSTAKRSTTGVTLINGEIDIMIASQTHRSLGLGHEAVSTLLSYIHKNMDGILTEYGSFSNHQSGTSGEVVLKDLVAKINASNDGSIALFKKLGFVQKGQVNYFGELQLVFEEFGGRFRARDEGNGYGELGWDRSGL